jgi:hypothetical protein
MSALPVVELSDEELMLFGTIGAQRAAKCISRKAQAKEGAEDAGDWQMVIEGVLGEGAAAKHYKTYITAMGGYGYIDIGGMYEVRVSKDHAQELRIKPEDKNHLPYIYLTGVNGKYVIRGWIHGKDAKRKEWFRDYKRPGHKVYWVPHSKLRSPSEVPTVLPVELGI